MSSQKYTTSNPYEAQFGYSRAVRRGQYIFVSGTTSVDPSTTSPTGSPIILHPDSAYRQSLQAFSEILKAVIHLGGKKEDITRIRMFVTYDEDTGEVSRALKETFGDVGPAATMIVGAKFVDKDMRVEIEADAVCLE
ncbi:hypothetical protein AX16_008361 [Volvariella volvacea WC 439]|nr:hypothetical protein AX16_008361 [Volvariella volvacea WC 439]